MPLTSSQLASTDPESTTRHSTSSASVAPASASSAAGRQPRPLWFTSTTDSSGPPFMAPYIDNPCRAAGYPGRMTKLDGRPVLVTGAGGFIGGHLVARLVERGRPRARLSSATTRATTAGRSTGSTRRSPRRSRSSRATCATSSRWPRGRRARGRLPPRRPDRDPVLVREPARLLRGERARHAQRRPGGARRRRRSAWSTPRRARSTASARTVPITEDHPLEPQSPYAASKVAADKLMDSYHRSLRPARDGPAAVQHLRPASSPRARSSRRSSARRWPARRCGSARCTRAATSPTSTTRRPASSPPPRRATRSSGARSSSAPATTSRSATSWRWSASCSAASSTVEHDPARVRPPKSEVERLISTPRSPRS